MLGSVGSCTDGNFRAGSAGSSASWFLFCVVMDPAHLTLTSLCTPLLRRRLVARVQFVLLVFSPRVIMRFSRKKQPQLKSFQEIVKVLIPKCHHVVVSIPEDSKVEVKLRSIAGSVYNHFRLMKWWV
jgi:hypothetical protein